jgi:uncharacterized protein (DUF1800 family)
MKLFAPTRVFNNGRHEQAQGDDGSMTDQNYADSAHFLRRAGFGGAPETISQIASSGPEATLAVWLAPQPEAPADPDTDPIFLRLQALEPPDKKKQQLPVQAVRIRWMHRMLVTDNPLLEKMVLFWHGHFTSKLGDGVAMLRQNELFRSLGLGDFRTLTRAISRDPAMLLYLNGNQNFKAHPNENYARELMELFTCGIGHYTEDDVKAGARAFSGWNLRRNDFFFNVRQHDDGAKTFLGMAGDWNGDDIVDRLVAHPATARRICTKLFAYFAYDDPEPAAIDALVKTYYDSGYEIGAVVGQILRSRAFYSAKARNALIKSPAQLVIGTVRMLGMEDVYRLDRTPAPAQPPAQQPEMQPTGKPTTSTAPPVDREAALVAGLCNNMRAMGQELLAPPSVKGWDGGETWINSATWQDRVAFADRMSRVPGIVRGQLPRAAARARAHGQPLTEAWVDQLCETLGPLTLAPEARQAIVDYVASGGPAALPPASSDKPDASDLSDGETTPNRQALRRRLQGALPLIMATAEYQVC